MDTVSPCILALPLQLYLMACYCMPLYAEPLELWLHALHQVLHLDHLPDTWSSGNSIPSTRHTLRAYVHAMLPGMYMLHTTTAAMVNTMCK